MAPRSAMALAAAALAATAAAQNASCVGMTNVYDSSLGFNFINGTGATMAQYAGRVTLLSNVASF